MKFDSIIKKFLNGLATGKSVDEIAKKHNTSTKHINSQLKKGIEVEMEHTEQKEIAKKIAMDHLFEDPNYYTKLTKIEEKK